MTQDHHVRIVKHDMWDMTTKLCYGYDSCMYICTTKLSDSHMSTHRRLMALKPIIKNNTTDVKIVIGDNYYYRMNGCTLRVYFNMLNDEAVKFLLHVTDKNTNLFDIVQVKSPKDEAHRELLNNKEITQIIRKQNYYDKYVYSVTIRMNAITVKQPQHQYQWSRSNPESHKRMLDMRKWLKDTMPNSMTTAYYDDVKIYTNDISALMMFRLSFDVSTCIIKEAIIVKEDKKQPLELKIVF